MSRLPAYILAGGRSRRMGRDKATLRPAPGEPTLAEQVAHALLAAGATPVHLVGRQPALQTLGFTVIPDPEGAGHHPLFGIAAALHHASTLGCSHALLVPCDVPGLTASALQPLLQADWPAVAVSGDHIQPLFCVLPVGWSTDAHSAAQHGRSARRFVARDGVARVRIAAEATHDLDTPTDLRAWNRRTGRTE